MEITYYKYKEKMPMKKFRFLIFMLVLTSIFIGCAQPTGDTVIPEVPKTTTEENDEAQSSWEDAFEEGKTSFNYTAYFMTVEDERWHETDTKNPSAYYIRLKSDYSFTKEEETKFTVSNKNICAYGKNALLIKEDVTNIIGMLINQNMLKAK